MRTLAVTVLALVVGCGSSDSGSTGGGGADAGPNNDGGFSPGALCAADSPPAGCGASCSLDEGCDDGLYCNSSDTCTADCDSPSQCGDGQTCTDRGRCVTEGGVGTDGGSCADVELSLTTTTPTVLLLIDRSSSMVNENLEPDLSRWQALQNALLDNTDGVLISLQDAVAFGGVTYGSANGNANPPCPRLQSSDPVMSTGNADAIADLFDNGTLSDTPTHESLHATYDNFPDPVEEGSPQILILATDGKPDTCAETSGALANAEPLVEDEVERGFGLGISTFVLSVGDDTEAAHLDRVANLGAGKDKDTGGEVAFRALNTQALIDAFTTIIQGSRSCVFTLNGTVFDGGETLGTVVLNGNELTLDSDWVLQDESTIALIDDACTAFKEADDVELSASFPCGAASIIE